MFFQLSVVILAASSVLAAATPAKRQDTVTSCNSGPVQCCNQVQTPESDNYSDFTSLLGATGILDSFGLSAQGLSAPIGINCTPLDGAGVGTGGTCNSEPVCCDEVHSSGAIALSCVPLTLNL
jgi:hypothetical protein